MSGAAAETVAAVLLILSLAVAITRPFGVSEALVAVPAAVVVAVAGIVSWDDVAQRLREIGPTVGFLAAILVFGHLCAEAGVFDYLGSVAARAGRGDPRRLLALVVALAAGVTAVLTLDATVVLLTPVVLVTARRLGVRRRPHAYACVRLANSGSLLLPVSNLTSLLAFSAARLSFARFAALMALPWLVVCVAEWLGLRWAFRRELNPGTRTAALPVAAPRVALGALAVTVAGIVVAASLHVAPAWAALGGCLLLLVARARSVRLRPVRLIREASPGFCVFVLALAVLVEGVTRHGLGDLLAHVVPSGSAFPALLALVAVAAVLANLVNNLPATLVLVPLTVGNPAAVLAVLIGVNVGPNATYVGSLATLLWRRVVPAADRPRAAEFHLLGLVTVPLLLLLATLALWASLAVLGT